MTNPTPQPPAPTPNVSETPTHEEARDILERFVRSHFHEANHARFSIPANPQRDDDIRLAAYIKEAEATAAQLAAVTKERDELKEDNDYRRTEMGNVWEMVQKISPWQESNDMNWSDEISCGLNGIAEQLTAALARAEKAEEALRAICKHAQRYSGRLFPLETARKALAANAALTPTKEPAP